MVVLIYSIKMYIAEFPMILFLCFSVTDETFRFVIQIIFLENKIDQQYNSQRSSNKLGLKNIL